MKKRIITISIVILIITIISIKIIPFGLKKHIIKATYSNINFKIPKLSYVTRETERYLELKSFRSKKSLEKEFKYINNNFKEYYCNNEIMYYDEKENLTIKEIKYKNDLLLNKVQIYITEQLISNDKCAVVKDYKKTDFYFQACDENVGCYGTNNFKYLNTDDNEIYNLYYNHSKFILFKTGLENYNYLTSMLKVGWISMNTVINYLDYESENGNITKEIDINKQYTKYYNEDLLVVQCTTKNKDIYIEDYSEINKDFCTN